MAPADRDGSGRPLYSARQADYLTSLEEELEACPDFIREAITEEADEAQLAKAIVDGDGQALLEVVRAAQKKYREFLVEKGEGAEDDHQRLQFLLTLYRPAVGAQA